MEKTFLNDKAKELDCEFNKKSKEFFSNKKEEVKVEEIKEEVKND
jgi:hypothetical protein